MTANLRLLHIGADRSFCTKMPNVSAVACPAADHGQVRRRAEQNPASAEDASVAFKTVHPEGIVAGHRVIRLLGTGDRAVVYLGHSGAASAVALKVFRADTEPSSIELDIAVLTSAAAPGLVRLLDVAQLGDGRVCLVLERLTGGSLARYLVEHPRLSPGEAVTLLAPIIVALGGLHAAGFTHGAINQSTILLDASGRSVVTGFGAVAQLADVPRERMRRLRADYERLGVVMASIVEAVDPTDSHRASGAALLRRFQAAYDPVVPPKPSEGTVGVARVGSILGTLEHDLFHWADAKPLQGFQLAEFRDAQVQSENDAAVEAGAVRVNGVQLRHSVLELNQGTAASDDYSRGVAVDDAQFGHARQGRLDHGFDDTFNESSNDRPSRTRFGFAGDALGSLTARGAALAGRMQSQASTGRFATVVDSLLDSHPLQAVAHALRKRLHGHRRPLLVAALAGASILVLALTLFPVSGRAGESRPPGAAGVAGTANGSARATDLPTAGSTTAAPTTGEAADAAGAEGLSAIVGDNPVSAVPALLVRRAACLAAASLVCLVDVDQTGSAILSADSYDARERQQGGSRREVADYTGYLPSLAERSGDLAVVALTPAPGQQKNQPASVLVVKGEGGWRLREIFDY